MGAVTLGWEAPKQGGPRVQKRKWVYGATRKEVADKIKIILRDQQQGVPIATERMNVEQLLNQWLADTVAPNTRDKTAHSYRQVVRLHIVPTLGSRPIGKLTPQHVQQLMNAKRAEGLSPRYVIYIRNILRQALNQALRWGYVARNVATLVDPPKMERGAFTVLTPAQARVFLEHARMEQSQIATLCALALGLGLRQGEVLGLRWSDISLEARTLTVSKALSTVAGKGTLAEPKTSQSRRDLMIPGWLATMLHGHQSRQLSQRLKHGLTWQHQNLVFCTGEGKTLSARNVVRDFKALLGRMDLPDMRFHDLRHSCNSLLAAQGLDSRTRMEVMGHADVRTTQNIYTHVFSEGKQRAADMMDTMVEEQQVDEQQVEEQAS